MQATRPRYIVDEKGKKVAVVLEIAEYERLIDRLEELSETVAYLDAKLEGGEAIPLDQAMEEIERERGWRTA
jgi:PHD/YefM family antitoxin component YafN of YafNO toxin-antitoxin module